VTGFSPPVLLGVDAMKLPQMGVATVLVLEILSTYFTRDWGRISMHC